MNFASLPALAATWLGSLVLVATLASAADRDDSPALPEEPAELATLPERPRPLLEVGEAYLAPSRIGEGFTLPTGAVWQPSLLAWGTLRSALQGAWGRSPDRLEWANRFDLFGQLSLTPTERVVVGLEPFQDGAGFTGYRFPVGRTRGGYESEEDFDVDVLFVEGDLGELFPRLDRDRWWPLDLGFMAGRVPVVFQDGFLLDDRMTAAGIARNSLLAPGTSNLRVSLLTAWDAVDRGDGSDGGGTRLFGVFSEFDRPSTTWALDLVYVEGERDTDALFGGVSAIRRLRGRWNLTLRALGSHALGRKTPAVDDGGLGVLGLSVAPRGTHDQLYLNAVAAIGDYSAAARDPERGGPLGRVGILFEAFGLGTLPAPLDNGARRVLGGALGYHAFFQGGRRQLVLELGGRTRSDTSRESAGALALRLQQALGRRFILRTDAWGGYRRSSHLFGGARGEIVAKF